jgi:hypothetical protein
VPHANTSLILRYGGNRSESFDNVEAFVSATVEAVRAQPTTEAVYAFWEANLDRFAALPRPATSNAEDPVQAIRSALKTQLRVLGRGHGTDSSISDGAQPDGPETPAQLLIPKEKRIRDKAHLAFVAKEPCLVCGRKLAQAHHIRFAQPRALGLKVSDEFTVPLCNGHHDSLHRTGDERAWWARNGHRTVRRIEAAVDEITGTAQTVSKIQRALETAGIIFIDQDEKHAPGVRLRKPPP